MENDWASTPQENVLNLIYESLPAQSADIYGVAGSRTEALLYVTIDGECWEIFAKPHPHVRYDGRHRGQDS